MHIQESWPSGTYDDAGRQPQQMDLDEPVHSVLINPGVPHFDEENTVDINLDGEVQEKDRRVHSAVQVCGEEVAPGVEILDGLRLPECLLRSSRTFPGGALYGLSCKELHQKSLSPPLPASSATSSQSSASASGEKPAAPVLVAPSVANIIDSVPHPQSFFCPESSAWIVVHAEAGFWRPGANNPSLSYEPIDTSPFRTPIYFSHFATVSPGDQARPPLVLMPLDIGQVSSELYEATSRVELPESTSTSDLQIHFDVSLKTANHIITTGPKSIPGIIPIASLESFKKTRESEPRAGLTGEQSFRQAVSLLLKIVGNAICGETRGLALKGTGLQNKLGWDTVSKEIFLYMGWQVTMEDESPRLTPPKLQGGDSGAQWRLRTIRCLVELWIWAHHHLGGAFDDIKLEAPHPPQVRIISADAPIFNIIGRSETTSYINSDRCLDAYIGLGGTIGIPDELLKSVYQLNRQARTLMAPTLFTHLVDILNVDRPRSEELQVLIVSERSRDCITVEELLEDYRRLGLMLDWPSHEPRPTLKDFLSVANDDIANAYLERLQEGYSLNSLTAFDPAIFQAYQNIIRLRPQAEKLSAALAEGEAFKIMSEKAAEPMTLAEARALLLDGEDDSQQDDDTLIVLYEIRATDQPDKVDRLREALRFFGDQRDSSRLKQFATTGEKVDSTWQDNFWGTDNRPAGLDNIGNTCFLNSVLQYFFVIREIRDKVLAAAEDWQGGELDAELPERRVGGRVITQKEVARSRKFVLQLGQLFHNMITTPVAAVRPEREVAYLALVSLDAEHNYEKVASALEAEAVPAAAEGTALDVAAPSVDPSKHQDSTEADVKMDAVELVSSAGQEAPQLPPRPKTTAIDDAPARQNSLLQLGAQQDVSECLDNVMFQIEVALGSPSRASAAPASGTAPSEEPEGATSSDSGDLSLLQKLFLGRTAQRVQMLEELAHRPGKEASIHTKTEIFKILPVDVTDEGHDLYDAMDGFFDEETLVGTNGKSMLRTVALVDPPPFLQIQLQRVQYDRVKGLFKSQVHLEIGESLFMDRYLDFDPLEEGDQPRIEKRKLANTYRKEMAALREQIAALRPRSKPTIPAILSAAGAFLRDLQSLPSMDETPIDLDSIDDLPSYGSDPPLGGWDFPLFLETESKALGQDLKEAEEQIRSLKASVEKLWEDERRSEYQLTSVFTHRGEASHGHYWLSQRKLPESSDTTESEWFKYNDSVVSPVSRREVLRDTSGATPYLLIYVRKDLQDQVGLVETIRREIEPLPQEDVPVPGDATGSRSGAAEPLATPVPATATEKRPREGSEEVSLPAKGKRTSPVLGTPSKTAAAILAASAVTNISPEGNKPSARSDPADSSSLRMMDVD